MPKGTDSAFLRKLASASDRLGLTIPQQQRRRSTASNKSPPQSTNSERHVFGTTRLSPLLFSIKHFAGVVSYSSENFLTKNNGEVSTLDLKGFVSDMKYACLWKLQ
jgi:hypothetical protein